MALFTPKNHPWRPTKGYETIDAFPVPSQPVTNQRTIPCYIPNGMSITPLQFPNLVIGFNRNPAPVARAALKTRYTSGKWFENQQSLIKEASLNLHASGNIRENLDNLVRKAKEKFTNFEDENCSTKNTQDVTANELRLKVDELSSALENIIKDNKKMQNFKRKLQDCIQSIEAPLQISQECLYHREFRNRSELINDEVEQLLMKEIEIIRESEKKLNGCLEQCENQLIQGRKVQNSLENCIKTLQWAVFVDRSKKQIKKFSESNSWIKDSECLLQNTNSVVEKSMYLKKQLEVIVNEETKKIVQSWNETSYAFTERCNQMKQAISEIECYLGKIKNEIYNIEKNLKYLKTNKEICAELQQGEDQLKTLIRTKNNLDSDLSSKKTSLFIDEQKCVTMRKCYPISIIEN